MQMIQMFDILQMNILKNAFEFLIYSFDTKAMPTMPY